MVPLAKKSSKFFKEFKEFALRGNVIDLAVGVIIGGALQNIIQSVVNDLIMPVVGMLCKTDFSNLYLPLYDTSQYPELAGASLSVVRDEHGLPVFAYGRFLTQFINFMIMAFVIFLMVKGLNTLSHLRLHKAAEAAPLPTTKVCPYCRTEIDVKATRCPHCTSELETDLVSHSSDETST